MFKKMCIHHHLGGCGDGGGLPSTASHELRHKKNFVFGGAATDQSSFAPSKADAPRKNALNIEDAE